MAGDKDIAREIKKENKKEFKEELKEEKGYGAPENFINREL